MADFTVKGDTSLDASGASKGFDKISKGFSGIANVGVSAAKGLLTTMAGVSTAIVGVGISAVKYNANLEQYATSFEVMTGSAEAAAKVVADLKTMGASTPFEFEDLAKGTQTLMSFGRTTDQAGKDLKMLGDISQGNAGKLETLTRAFGKMTSSGKVSLEDINMMIDSGFNPLQQITESTGESMSSLYDRISKGTISVDEITAAMEKSTSAGGKYFQSMEKQSQTINGQLSTLKDNAQSLIGEIFAGVTETVGTSALPMLNDWVSQLSEAFKSGGVEGVVTSFGDVLAQAMGALGEASPAIFEMAASLVDSFVNGIISNIDPSSEAFTGMLTSLITSIGDIGEDLFTGGVVLLNSLLMGIATGMPTFLEGFGGNLNGMIDTLVAYGPTMLQSGLMIIGQLAIGLLQAIPGLMDTMISGLSGLTESVNTSGDGMVESGVALIGNLLMGIANKLPDLLTQGLLLVMALVGAIGQNLPEILRMAEQLIITLVDGIIRNIPKLLVAASKMIGKLVEGLLAGIPELIIAAGKLILKINSAFNDVDWGTIGVNIIKGIVAGLSSAAGNLADAAVEAAKEAFEAAKKFLKIKSPSRLYRDEIGLMQMAGWETGVEKGTPSVVKANTDAAKEMVASAQDVVLSSQLELGRSYVQGLGGESSGASSVTNQTSLVQNFYSQVVSAYDAYKRRIDYVL